MKLSRRGLFGFALGAAAAPALAEATPAPTHAYIASLIDMGAEMPVALRVRLPNAYRAVPGEVMALTPRSLR